MMGIRPVCSTRSSCWLPAETIGSVSANSARISRSMPRPDSPRCARLRSQNAARLRETAHKLCGLLSAFSTMAGNLASDLEDHAARGELDERGPW